MDSALVKLNHANLTHIFMIALVTPTWPVMRQGSQNIAYAVGMSFATLRSVALIAGLLPCRTFASCAPTLPFCQSPITKEYPIARFAVVENFVGAEAAEFEVRMTSDFFINGIPQQVPAFREGEVWLVEAYYDNHEQKWMTSMCQRTRPAEQAEQELQALRTWAGGQRLPARVTGQVVDLRESKNTSAARVELRTANGAITATTDRAGLFSFDNIETGVYEAVTEGARSTKVDLSRAWCSYIVLLVQ